MKSIKIYVDMDGVLAKWDSGASLEETYLPGFFLTRQPEPSVIGAVKILMEQGLDVCILSCAYENGYAAVEKGVWLDRAGLSDIPRVFVPYGKKKTDYIRTADVSVLLDDYSRNLHEWREEGNVGFKFYNGVNGNHGTWHGYSVDYRMTPEQIALVIAAVAKETAQLLAAG